MPYRYVTLWRVTTCLTHTEGHHCLVTLRYGGSPPALPFYAPPTHTPRPGPREMMGALTSAGGGEVHDLLFESLGRHESSRPPRLQFPRNAQYIFKHK